MRIKTDFVTNSSSTCYTLALTEEELIELTAKLKEVEAEAEYINEGIGVDDVFRTMKELKNYTTGRPIDWVSKARGQKFEFWDLDPDSYKEYAKIIIKQKKLVVRARIDYGSDYSLVKDPEWTDKVLEYDG